MDDWRKECAVCDTKDYKLYMAGRIGMKTACLIAMAKTMPRMRMVVIDIATLDMLVARGVKPSQIILTSECNNTSRFDMLSIDGVEQS